MRRLFHLSIPKCGIYKRAAFKRGNTVSDEYLQIQGFKDIYCQSKDMGDFLSLQGKLEPQTLTYLSIYSKYLSTSRFIEPTISNVENRVF